MMQFVQWLIVLALSIVSEFHWGADPKIKRGVTDHGETIR